MLSKREQINEVLRIKLDEVTERWGGKVTTVEIREITPPRDVQDAMNRQLSAERTRRAVITESEGTRQSAINVAEGAEAVRDPARPRATRQAGRSCAPRASARRSSGSSRRPRTIDEKTMALQYLEALKAARREPVDEVRHPDRVHRARGSARRGLGLGMAADAPAGSQAGRRQPSTTRA